MNLKAVVGQPKYCIYVSLHVVWLIFVALFTFQFRSFFGLVTINFDPTWQVSIVYGFCTSLILRNVNLYYDF